MAGSPLVNCKVYVGGIDLSGDSNSLNLVHAAEMLDGTVFQESSVNRTRAYTPGLKTIEISANLFWNNANDERLYSRLGLANEVITVALLGETEGDRTFFTRGIRGAYNPLSGEVVQIITAQLDARNAGYDLVRGQLMTRGTKAATGDSTGINMGCETQPTYKAGRDRSRNHLRTFHITRQRINLLRWIKPANNSCQGNEKDRREQEN